MRRPIILLLLCAGLWSATAYAREEQFVDIRDVPAATEQPGNFRFQPNLYEQAMEAVPRIHRLNELKRRQTSQAAPAVPVPTPAPSGPGFVSVHEPTAEDVAQEPSIDAETGAIQLPVTTVTPRPAAPAPPPKKSAPPASQALDSKKIKAEERQLRQQAERVMKLERTEIEDQTVPRKKSQQATAEKARRREEKEKLVKTRQELARQEKMRQDQASKEKEDAARREKRERQIKERQQQSEAKRVRAEAEAQRRAEALLTRQAKKVADKEARRALDSGQDQLQEEADSPLTEQEKRRVRRQVQSAQQKSQRQEESVERAKLRVSPPDKAQQTSIADVQEKVDETMADASWRTDLQKTAAVWVEQEESVSSRRVEKQTLKAADAVVTARDRSAPADIEKLEPLDRPVGRMFYRRAFIRKVLNRLAREAGLELALPPAAEKWSTQEVTVDFGNQTVGQALAKLQQQIPGWRYAVEQGQLKIVLDS